MSNWNNKYAIDKTAGLFNKSSNLHILNYHLDSIRDHAEKMKSMYPSRDHQWQLHNAAREAHTQALTGILDGSSNNSKNCQAAANASAEANGHDNGPDGSGVPEEITSGNVKKQKTSIKFLSGNYHSLRNHISRGSEAAVNSIKTKDSDLNTSIEYKRAADLHFSAAKSLIAGSKEFETLHNLAERATSAATSAEINSARQRIFGDS